MGNSHAKEIVVDRKIHMSGSHNWLSYRGDRLPRGETVHQVTNTDLVQEAYEFLAGRFQSHAQKLWDEAARKHDDTLAVAPLCVWGALDMHEEALNQLRHNNWLQLLPLWLKVVSQGLRSQKVSLNSASLKTAISLLSQISAADPNIESLREGWQKVVGAIACQDRDAALRLLSDEAWLQFARLDIAQPPIDSLEKFISKYSIAQKQPYKNFKEERQNTSHRLSKNKS